MIVNAINTVGHNTSLGSASKSKANFRNYNYFQELPDNFNKSSLTSPHIYFENGQKNVKIISFAGGLRLPKINPADLLIEKPAIQMRVTGVTNFQDNMKPELLKYHDFFSINKMSDGNWTDGDPIHFKLDSNKQGPLIRLYTQNLEEIGRVPDEITPEIYDLLRKKPRDFKFELSNMVAGKTPGAPTIGLRVNLLYTGVKNKFHNLTQEAFDNILNNPEAAKKAFFYQPKKSPNEVLDQIFKNVEKAYGEIIGKKIVENMKKSLSTIIEELESPDNKKILLVGHNKPDGDTLGSVNGLANMLRMLFPEKHIDCAIADEIPSVYRKNLPGMENIKHPYSEIQIKEIEEKLAKALKDSVDKNKIKSLEESLKLAKDPTLLLNEKEKYDAVMLMDIPSPARFTSGFKKWIEEAKTVMYVDHHPLELEKWRQAKALTGVDMDKIIKNNCAWIADQVAAAAQQAVIIASKLKAKENPLNPDNYIKTANTAQENKGLYDAIKSFTTGIWTDTSGFARNANLLTKDMKDAAGNIVPVQNRPNYWPEGMVKYLFSLTNGEVDKKWFHDNINFILGYREKMIDTLLSHRYSNTKIGFGYTKASFEEIKDILENAQIEDVNTNFSDVVNEMKLSEVMGQLRESSEKGRGNIIAEKLNEEPGLYDRDKIAVFISESEKAGELNTEGNISENNALRFSFRSAEGTNHAELLASLFNGGGHGAAAGGHLIGKNITIDSTFKVRIDGKITENPKEIFSALKENFQIKHNIINLTEKDAQKLTSKLEVIEDKNGKTPDQIMEDLVTEIRDHDMNE